LWRPRSEPLNRAAIQPPLATSNKLRTRNVTLSVCSANAAFILSNFKGFSSYQGRLKCYTSLDKIRWKVAMPNRILLVEDDDATPPYITDALSDEGFTVDRANNGSAALQAKRNGAVDATRIASAFNVA
jgi:hypothetical protein